MRTSSRLVVGLLALVLSWVPARAQTRVRSEYDIKGAFVFNVLNFVEWPPSSLPPDGPILLAVLASSPLPDFSAAFAGKSIKGHAVVVTVYQNASDVGPCHVVFISADAASQVRAVLHAVNTRAVLTIAEQSLDSPGVAVISVGVAQTKLGFHVNLDAADASGLQINPNLLKLAKSVQSARVRAGTP